MAAAKRVNIDHTGMCITYLLTLKKIESFFEQNGFVKSDNVCGCDYAVIGACASFLPFFDDYKRKIDNAKKLRKKIIIYGCIPLVDHDFHAALFKDESEFIFIPVRHPELFDNIIDKPSVRWAEISNPTTFRRQDYTSFDENKRFITIQEGCTSNCFCCPHKMAIGKHGSISLESILSQINAEIDKESKIFILNGEDAGAWGTDFSPPLSYADLIDNIVKIIPHSELHLDNIAPKHVLKNRTAFQYKNVTDIKIPIQTSSKRLLRLINRDTTTEIQSFLARLKDKNPNLVLRTEIIIGFPTETTEELVETLRFVSESFDKVACYSFDYHPRSRLAELKIPPLEKEVVEERIMLAKNFFKDKTNVVATFSFGEVMASVNEDA